MICWGNVWKSQQLTPNSDPPYTSSSWECTTVSTPTNNNTVAKNWIILLLGLLLDLWMLKSQSQKSAAACVPPALSSNNFTARRPLPFFHHQQLGWFTGYLKATCGLYAKIVYHICQGAVQLTVLWLLKQHYYIFYTTVYHKRLQ